MLQRFLFDRALRGLEVALLRELPAYRGPFNPENEQAKKAFAGSLRARRNVEDVGKFVGYSPDEISRDARVVEELAYTTAASGERK